MTTTKVTERALIQRINRKLAKENEVLKKTPPERNREGISTVREHYGDYYTLDQTRNQVSRAHLDLESFGRELGALAELEQLEDDSKMTLNRKQQTDASKEKMDADELYRRIQVIRHELEVLIDDIDQQVPCDVNLPDSGRPDTKRLMESNYAFGGPSGLYPALAALESWEELTDDTRAQLAEFLDPPEVQRQRNASKPKLPPELQKALDALR